MAKLPDEIETELAAPLAHTPLFDLSLEMGARMTAFSGWEMPVQYSSITQEHQAVRQSVGIFDISHMGKFVFSGVGLVAALQPLVPSDLSRLQPGQAQYSVLLNTHAGILDDLIFYYQGETDGEQRGVMIVNAATRTRDQAWILAHLEPYLQAKTIQFQDLSLSKVLIAVQGSQAAQTLQMMVQEDLTVLQPFEHLEATIMGQPGFIARTGYTGEDGFEVMVYPEAGIALWRSLIAAGAIPCGLGARDTLRLEAAMGLYGQDLDATTTPLEAGLGWVVHLDKGEFLGRSVLEQQKQHGVERKLVGLKTEGRNIARHGYPILFKGEAVGVVTSGTLSPTLGYPVALGYVPTALSQVGQVLEVEIRGKTYPTTVVKRPFYRRSRSPHL